MATENILIKFTSDTSGLKDSVTELQKIGKLTEEDAKKFAQMEGFAEGVADALKEAGVDAKTLNKALVDSANSGKSLKAQFTEAKNEAVKLSNQFGAFSKEAREAAKRAAEIKDEISDMNDVFDALNPEARLNAFVKLGQGIQGGFQAATGALQLFGVENERVTKIAQQFQGALNIVGGVNSVLQLKDVYSQLRLVLGVTTAAQTGLTAATTTGAVVQGVATTATNRFTAALLANPFTAVAVVLAVLVAGLAAYVSTAESAAEATDKLKKSADELDQQQADSINEKYKFIIRELTQLKELRVAEKAETVEILKLEKQIADVRVQGIKEFIANFGTTATLRKQLDEVLNAQAIAAVKLNQEIKRLADEQAVLADQAKNVFTKASILPSEQQVIEDVRQFMDVVGVAITTLSTDLPQLPFFSEEELQQKREDLANFFNEITDAYSQLNNGLLALNNQLYANDLENLKVSREQGFLTEKQYNDKVKALREKQFEINKKAQIAQAIIGTAQGIINALAVTPTEAVPAAIALASAVGAINLARIIATEPPKFKKGTLNVGGGNLDADGGMHAIIHRGEAVIPSDRNRDYHPTIKALYNRQIKPSEINAFVASRLGGKLPTSINAKLDTNKLGKMMKGSGVVELSNARAVGKIIASELNKSTDIRRW